MTTVRPICGGANCDRALVVGAAVDGLFPKNEQQQNKRRSTAPTPSPTNPRAAIFGFEIGFTGFFFYRVFVGLVCLFVCFLDRTRFFFYGREKVAASRKKNNKKTTTTTTTTATATNKRETSKVLPSRSTRNRVATLLVLFVFFLLKSARKSTFIELLLLLLL